MVACNRRARLTLAIALSIVGMPAPVFAQVASFHDLASLVEPDMTVAVTDATGHEVKGNVAEISASSLTLAIDGTLLDLDEADVVRVSRPAHGFSRVWGGLIGFGTGLGVVAGVAALTIVASDNEGSTLDPNTGNTIAWSVMLGGAALGAVYIHPTEEELLFESRGAAESALTLSVSPVLSKKAKGVALSIRW